MILVLNSIQKAGIPMRSFIVPAFYLLSIFSPEGAFGQAFLVSNPSGVSRIAGELVISRENLRNLMDVPAAEIPVLYVGDKVIPSQTDDITRDGLWDELAFQLDIERNASVQVKVKWVSEADAPAFSPRVRCLLGLKNPTDKMFMPADYEMLPEDWSAGKMPERYLCEGPVWESEKVAFRHFFDERNFTSPLLKKSYGFLTDSIKIRGKDYPVVNALRSDSGLGAGGFALAASGKWNIPSKEGNIQYRLLANGPVRAVFELLYEDWALEENMLNIRRRVSIWAGSNFYKTELTVSGFSGEMETAVGMSSPKGQVRVEELPPVKDISGFFLRQIPAEANEPASTLGMILPANDNAVISAGAGEKSGLPADSRFRNYRIKSGQLLEYRVFAASEKKGDLPGNSPDFRNMMLYEMECIAFPLAVSR
jgi:hypothetical protein